MGNLSGVRSRIDPMPFPSRNMPHSKTNPSCLLLSLVEFEKNNFLRLQTILPARARKSFSRIVVTGVNMCALAVVSFLQSTVINPVETNFSFQVLSAFLRSFRNGFPFFGAVKTGNSHSLRQKKKTITFFLPTAYPARPT